MNAADAAPEPIRTASGERAWLLRGARIAARGGSLWTAIDRQLERRASDLCVTAADRGLTGGDVRTEIDRLTGLPPASPIGVHVSRSLASVIAALAIWRAGATYVPLARELPAQRTAAMVAGLDLAAIISDDPAATFAGYETSATVAVGGRNCRVLRRVSARVAATAGGASRTAAPCYIAHTSGTTGAPKAILVSHAALLNRMGAMAAMTKPTGADAVLFKTSLAFDVHVWEFVLPLISGARLVILDQQRYFDPAAIVGLMARERVTIAGFVPTVLSAMLDRPDFGGSSALRVVFCGGEAWDGALARRAFRRLPGCVLRNSYGPAETTLAVANWQVPADDTPARIEIGAPLDNMFFIVEEVEHAEGWVTGLLAIGGAQVADGYAKPVTPDPFVIERIDGRDVRFYRTGDLFALDPARGTLVYRGRQDRQVKLNGVRIELGEIESVVLSFEAVEASVALIVPQGSGGYLLATCKVRDGFSLDPATVRARCAERLPAPHVPSVILQVDAYPTLPSGKIDHAALRASVTAMRAQAPAAPFTAAPCPAALSRSPVGSTSVVGKR